MFDVIFVVVTDTDIDIPDLYLQAAERCFHHDIGMLLYRRIAKFGLRSKGRENVSSAATHQLESCPAQSHPGRQEQFRRDSWLSQIRFGVTL